MQAEVGPDHDIRGSDASHVGQAAKNLASSSVSPRDGEPGGMRLSTVSTPCERRLAETKRLSLGKAPEGTSSARPPPPRRRSDESAVGHYLDERSLGLQLESALDLIYESVQPDGVYFVRKGWNGESKARPPASCPQAGGPIRVGGRTLLCECH
ncbi:hypothetical protein EYF80_007387 [Liparis tanakae]|uniref:Uncharacterized protein n=1 Tax=Liparis tanakae TaxID=230148 RepID=A0A4Z2IWY5_9TELE|nr:hypothetical protein EYF80_007387 [Liparis tanakae]